MRLINLVFLPPLCFFTLLGCTSTSKSQGNPIPVSYTVSIEPKDSRTGEGNTSTIFRATVTENVRKNNISLNSSAMNITWSIENAPGYDVGSIETIKMLGSPIDGNGLYHAPAALPTGVENVTVTIKITLTPEAGYAPQSATTTLKIENVVNPIEEGGAP